MGVRTRIAFGVVTALTFIGAAMPSAAQESYPNKPITMITPEVVGSAADLLSRVIARLLADAYGQPVTIENIYLEAGVEKAIKSPPDGYTLMYGSSGNLALLPHVKKVAFDPTKDLTPVARFVLQPTLIAVNPSLPVNTLQELVAYARANPRKINYGSAGIGTITHLAVELLRTEAKIDVVHVPYRGAAPAVNDLIGGHVQMVVLDTPVLLPHIRAGTVKALAVTSQTRSGALPDVPTTGEAGFKTVLSDNWYGLSAPAGVAPESLDKLHKAVVATLRSAELKKLFDSQDAVPAPTSPAEFAAFVKAEQAKWGPVVAATGAKLE
jgi:tripartite-type tricarboxylate transporter receptor subunit TctC